MTQRLKDRVWGKLVELGLDYKTRGVIPAGEDALLSLSSYSSTQRNELYLIQMDEEA